MKYAIMSDVHANPTALETALEDACALGCKKFVLCGDVTGYGYDVVGTMKLVRENFDLVLMGNHDSACVGLESPLECKINHNYHLDAVEREQLAPADLAWLRERRYRHAKNGVAFSHGDFIEPSMWGYIIDSEDALRNFQACGDRLMFCGHSHHAEVWERRKDGTVSRRIDFDRPAVKAESVRFVPKKDSRYIINVGSVGYPRNDLCSTYAIWNTESDWVTVRRLPFDFKSYVKSMLARGVDLPDWLVRMLLAAVR